jgi:putative ABC transport system ATP-binding protein
VTLAIAASEFTAIMGPSGSGKSTLLHCMAGLDSGTSGRVLLGDRDLGALTDQDLTVLRRERIGFVFQAFNLVPTLSALGNIRLPFTLGSRSPDPEWLDEVVETLGLRRRLQHRPSQLSGGEQQRVAIARALVARPDVVLQFLRRAVNEFAQTIVMVTHDPAAAAHADSVVFLSDGRVVDEMQDPSAQRVLDRMTALGS